MLPADPSGSPFYETDRALSEYLLFHYGSPKDILPYPFGPRDALDFAVRCVSHCVAIDRLPHQARALDLGCAVGRSTFELTRHSHDVLGIDLSERFIDAAQKMARHGKIEFPRLAEGDSFIQCRAELPSDIDRSRARFQQGDAMNLPSEIGKFELILCANLVDRLPDPAKCLKNLLRHLTPGGQLILTSPYTWTEAYTPKEAWLGLGGQDALSALRRLLEPACNLIERRDLPFLIREHNRKYQWSVAEATTWMRR